MIPAVTSRVNEGVNPDMVTWYKDNVVIYPGEQRNFGNANKQLIITKPTAADEGLLNLSSEFLLLFAIFNFSGSL